MQIHTEIHNHTNPQQITALNQPMVIVHSPLTFEQTMALANNDRITCIELRTQQHPNFISAFGGFKKDLVALKFNYPDD